MQDNNSSNLPILDDIITPGDADKAVHRPSRKVQGTLWENEPADPATEEPHSEENLYTDIEQPVDNSEAFATDEPPVEAIDLAETHARAEADNTPPVEQPPPADSSTDSVNAAQTPFTGDDIASLTDEIMACMTPEIERILRVKIRQILVNRLPVSTDSDPE
ncbi:MAG: hypothetical protein PVG12_07660 [Gammaproteobacteria bacterium]|jgi:hypothetical protein